MKSSTSLTPLELEIMHLVWDRGEATVRDVYEALRERRPIAYTTVLTMMSVLAEKKHLKRRPRNRAHVYRPSRPKTAVLRGLVRDFVDRVFEGSADALLVHLVDDRKLSKRELDALRRRLDEEDA